MQSRWLDGQPMRKVAASFIKRNDRLRSFERLEIYNRQYWFRLLDCLWDDYPGLRAVLGTTKFRELRVAYLNRHPSCSFTLRNLGSRLAEFIGDEPQWTAPRTPLCIDMAQLEWAQVIAFDSQANPPLDLKGLPAIDPSRIKVSLQPHITLLKLNHPVDEFLLALKNVAVSRRSKRRLPLPRRELVHVAVHRSDNQLYYKRLDPFAFYLLCALHEGASIAVACSHATAVAGSRNLDVASRIKWLFESWSQLGWICYR
jgi:hypothetical protein